MSRDSTREVLQYEPLKGLQTRLRHHMREFAHISHMEKTNGNEMETDTISGDDTVDTKNPA